MTVFPTLEFSDYLLLPDSGTVLLTVNARLARSLHSRYGEAHGQAIWQTPTIVTPSAWIDQLSQQMLLSGALPPPPLCLSAERELWLWEQVIRSQESDNWLLDPRDAAQLAQQAHAIEIEWQLQINPGQFTTEYRRYRQWKQAFYQRCAERDWLDEARLLSSRVQALAAQPQFWPQQLLLAGFDDLSPLWEGLFTALAAQGVAVSILSEAERQPPRWRAPCADSDAELFAAARWANQQTGQRIGIVVPDLNRQRPHLARVFDSVLHPETLAPHRYEMQRLYNISLGAALGSVPLLRCASDALQLLCQAEVELASWAVLLQSPFLHDNELALQLGREEARWREDGLHSRSWAKLGDQAWAQVWRNARYSLTRPSRRLPSIWAEQFAAVLQSLGWPGARSLSSHEFQALADFRLHLARFATLDDLSGALNLGEAVTQLRRQLDAAIFQVRTEDEAPIQIIGLLEAGGLEFDATWIVGLSDDVLPAAPRPNPLLPIAVQQQAGTPHASARRESRFASQLLQHLAQSTGLLIASHAMVEGERELRPSPLIADWPLYPESLLPEQHHWPEPQFEAIDEPYGPRLPAGRRLRGGAQILQPQALNPLWAFVEHRLGARPLPPWAIQPDPRLRGTLLHDIMERLWRRLDNQQVLQTLSMEQRQELITEVLEEALQQPKVLELTGASWRAIEKQRLQQLLQRWLSLESARPQPFHAVELEAQREWSHGSLQLKLRIDRIDASDNGWLLIDYKSGKTDSNAWGSADGSKPLTDVQLPLYAMLCQREEAIAGIAVACLHPAENRLGFKTTREQPLQPNPKAKTPDNDADWLALQQFWARSIVTLADAFVAGAAENRNAHPQALRYCPITPLLRVHVADDEASSAEDEV